MKQHILIVDDEPGVRESLNIILGEKYQTHLHSDAARAIDTAKGGGIDIALLDIKMPHMGGIELLERLKSIDPSIQVAMVTGYANLDTAVKALRLGAYDYINKPFSKDTVKKLVERGLELRMKHLDALKGLERIEIIDRELNERLKRTYSKTVESLLEAVNAKDSYTSNHSAEVAAYSMEILNEIDMPVSEEEKEYFHYVCTLHDIGKIGISESILAKTTSLTEKEMREIKKHPKIGSDILTPIEFLKEYLPMLFYHHEKYDGSGYPEGKKAEEIPLQARILAVADAYHAMRSDRPYRKAMSKQDAHNELKKGAGSHFDPEVVRAALKVLK